MTLSGQIAWQESPKKNGSLGSGLTISLAFSIKAGEQIDP